MQIFALRMNSPIIGHINTSAIRLMIVLRNALAGQQRKRRFVIRQLPRCRRHRRSTARRAVLALVPLLGRFSKNAVCARQWENIDGSMHVVHTARHERSVVGGRWRRGIVDADRRRSWWRRRRLLGCSEHHLCES